ncbi:MAG: 2-oxoacid:acceptor oxidoreductase family protein [Caldilineaceae bacterium]|nr:2-oxoacid:acceptor oxidoreductase family protein [Caldilineaceae bacterium]
MEQSIILAGFGGQGVLFAGQLLAYAALAAEKQVTWIPSYGPEMRGGTAHCTVIISDEPIGSPLVRTPDIVIAMNLPSAEKYAPRVARTGLFLINRSLVESLSQPPEVKTLFVQANQIAAECGTEKVANVVMLGALLALRPLLPRPCLVQALETHLPERHRRWLAANLCALDAGYAIAMHERKMARTKLAN